MPVFSTLSLADVPDGLRAPVDMAAPVDHRRAEPRHREALRYGSPLTTRELQVLRLAAAGMSNKEIGYELKPEVTQTTVKNHFSAVFIRLGANDRAHAVAIGIREGYVDVGPSTMPRPDHLTADEITVLRRILTLWESMVSWPIGR